MESPIFTLDEKTRRPLVQVLVDVALYAFHQGTEAQMEDEDPHATCEAQFIALRDAAAGLEAQLHEANRQKLDAQAERNRLIGRHESAARLERERILELMRSTGWQLCAGGGMNRRILSMEEAEVFLTPAAVPLVQP